MTTSVLLAAALGVPLALLLISAVPGARRRMGGVLPLAPIPALLAALLSDPAPLAVGTASFSLTFALDQPGAILLGAAAALWIVAGFYAAYWLRARVLASGFVVCWLMTLTGSVGVFVAADLVGFYFLLAVLTIGACGLVLQGDEPEARRACGVYLGLSLAAEAFLLAGLVLLAAFMPDGSLLIRDAAAALPTSPWRDLTLTLLVIGLGMKAGLVPLHFWMPLAHGVAPVPASAVLSGVVVKASVIALIRLLPFAVASPDIGRPLAIFGAFGSFYCAAIGITQQKPKVVLAYSTVSQMGFLIAIIGLGLSDGDPGTGLAAAAYAAHHLLVKGALFLGVGVMAATGRDRRWPILVAAAVIALGLGGLPLTGGALTKYVAKDLFGEGLASTLAFLSSVATTLLMLHFLARLAASTAADPARRAPAALKWSWHVMAAASLVVPWWLFLTIPNETMPKALAPANLLSALWPVLIGVGLAVVLIRVAWRLPRIPAGDVVVALDGLGRAGAATGALVERGDAVARRWPGASVTLLAVAALFGWTLAASP